MLKRHIESRIRDSSLELALCEGKFILDTDLYFCVE